MKIKALLLVGLFVLGLMFVAPENARADYVDATVVRTLPETTRFSVWLTEKNGIFVNKRFYFDSSHNLYNTWVATLLTAQSTNMEIRVGYIDIEAVIPEIISIGLGGLN